MFGNSLEQLAVVAVFVQRAVALLKPLYQSHQYQKYFDQTLAVVVSALLCVSWGVDVFAVVELAFPVVWLGAALTGLLAGLGANILNDVLVLLEMWKTKKRAEAATDTAIALAMTESVEEAKDRQEN